MKDPDLSLAEARIHELSAELHARREARGPGPTPAWRWFAIGIGISSAAMAALASLTWWSARPRTKPPAVVTAVPASVEPPSLVSLSGAQWYPQAGVGPVRVDLDGDGAEDVLGLVWKVGDDERALYVGAWNGKTFDLAWSAGPFPSQWSSMSTHLVAVGKSVVVTDTRESVHVMDLGTGRITGTIDFPRGAMAACATGDHDVLFDAGTRNARVLDTVALSVSPAPKSAACGPAPGFGATRTSDGDRIGPKVKMPGFYGYSSLREKVEMGGSDVDLRVTTAGVEKAGSFFTYAAGWDGKSTKLLWEHRLASDGDVENRRGTTHVEAGGGRVYFLYAKEGPFAGYQLAARSAKTGEELWSQPIPGTDQGTHVSTLEVEKDRVYVVTSQLSIFDAEHGFPVRTLPGGSRLP